MSSSFVRRLKKAIPERHPLRLAWHKGKAFAAALRYGFPARRLTVIGITGTDGKTTTVAMTAHMLNAIGIPAGALTTAFFRIKDTVEQNETQKTAPSPFVIQRFLQRLVRGGCTHAVLEYSSHGLVQGRTGWTWPAVAAITNTAMEHLDYHGTMEQYRKDKGILFAMLRGKGVKVLNGNDETYGMYRNIPSKGTVLYFPKDISGEFSGVRNNTVDCLWLENIQVTPHSSTANLKQEPYKLPATLRPRSGQASYKLTLTIPGPFNLENALCALSCLAGLGLPLEKAVESLQNFQSVVGRMEAIDEGQPFRVFVDFAITPQAFEKTLSTVRLMLEPGKRILVLTGSCGDRMKEKRPIVGNICSQLADVVVITDDEPYTEDPRKIIEEVWAGVDRSKTDAHKIFDRREAITFILGQARPGLLSGLGSYPSGMMKNGPVPWNEQEIVRELLRMQGYSPDGG